MSAPVGIPVAPLPPSPSSTRAVSHLRWGVCGLLFFATTINYIDRQVISLLKPVLEKKTSGGAEADYGWIVFSCIPCRLWSDDAPRRSHYRRPRHSPGLPYRRRLLERRRRCSTRSPAAHSFSSASPVLRSVSANPPTSPPRSRPSPHGSPCASARSPPASSTAAPTWALSSRLSPYPGLPYVHYGWRSAFIVTGGARGLSGSFSGGPSTAEPLGSLITPLRLRTRHYRRRP